MEKSTPKAVELHQQARDLGQQGDYEQAIKLLDEAHELAPDWPYPLYDMAFTCLLMKDAERARAYYRQTVELSPRGFFTAITAMDTLDKEAAGQLPAHTYLEYLSLEWIDDPSEKEKFVHSLVDRLPQFAPAWKELALLERDEEKKLHAIAKGLDVNPDSETLGMLLINKALVLHSLGRKDEAIKMLGKVAQDPNSTFANEHLAKSMLDMLIE